MKTPMERFHSLHGSGDGCWEWLGQINPKGYGIFFTGKLKFRAHRWIWGQTHGPISSEIFVLHHCDNRKCVRLSHLFTGTNQDNIDDMVKKRRNQRGEGKTLAKLTDDKVRAMRMEYATGVKIREIAKSAGVAFGTARNAIIGATWRHVI